jgi:hypothetical protein
LCAGRLLQQESLDTKPNYDLLLVAVPFVVLCNV